MTELLQSAIAAHGGQDAWDRVRRLDVHARIGGALWSIKGHGGKLADVQIQIAAREQRVRYQPFGAAERHSDYTPDRVAIVDETGAIIDQRDDPRASFADHVRATPWDELHLAYFSGYAIWNYLTAPFLFASPGFETEEIEPWDEDGERWRRLRVRFPDYVATHCPEQVFSFDQRGLLRRLDYQAAITAAPPAVHLTSKHRDFGGLIIPTERRVFPRRPDGRADVEPVLVAIDIFDVAVERD